MTPEELSRPRFRLIADYPGNTTEMGHITTEINTASYFRKFPANFKELEWWQERKEEDMPEYVKGIAFNNVVKVKFISNDGSWFGNLNYFKLFLPATREEYESQKCSPLK